MTRALGSDPEPRRIELYRPQNQLGDLLLNVPAIRALRDRGHFIGSHSCSHPTRMSACSSSMHVSGSG